MLLHPERKSLFAGTFNGVITTDPICTVVSWDVIVDNLGQSVWILKFIRRLVFVTVTKLGQCNQKWRVFRNCNQIWLIFVLCLHLLYLVTIHLFNNHFCSFINVYD